MKWVRGAQMLLQEGDVEGFVMVVVVELADRAEVTVQTVLPLVNTALGFFVAVLAAEMQESAVE